MSNHSTVRVICPETGEVLREIPIRDNPRAIHRLEIPEEDKRFLYRRRDQKKILKTIRG